MGESQRAWRSWPVTALVVFLVVISCAEPSAVDDAELAASTGPDRPSTATAAATGCNGTNFDNTDLLPVPPCVPSFEPAPPDFTVDTLQPFFDAFSWKSFVAFNWPVQPGTAEPDTGATIGATDAPTVWEAWKGTYEVFLPDGAEPAPWGQPGELPAECRELGSGDGMRLLPFAGKTPDVLTAFGEPFKTGPLIDQNGVYARFEILMNEPMFQYIVDNQLYNAEGQQAFARDADFPGDQNNAQAGVDGAIMVKAAWKVITPSQAGSFHTAKALVWTPPSENPPIKASCSEQLVGLVGLHIAHKTDSDPQWLWSTFEHVANAPQRDELPASGKFNFYNPGCESCPVNEPPARPWNPNEPPNPARAVQVVREIGITVEAAERTSAFHARLATVNPDSVWLNYELISTQWPTNAKDPTDPTGGPAPQFLGNTTLETYIQGKVPNVSSNCIECHNNAADTQGRFSDFTYMLQLAQPASAADSR